MRKLEEEKRKKEAEKYKHLNSGYRLGGCVNLGNVFLFIIVFASFS